MKTPAMILKNQVTKFQQTFLAIGSIVGWLTLLLQLFLLIEKKVTPPPEAILRFFSYFTILTNILVALYHTILLWKPASGLGAFFLSPKVLTAITVYISFVGLSYQFLLRHVWEPRGLDLVADELLHTIIPAFFIVYWFIFANKPVLKWQNILPWLIYPGCYMIYALIRGALSGWYPYPFIDVNKLGYNTVIINCAFLIVGFTSLALLFVAITKIISRTAKARLSQL